MRKTTSQVVGVADHHAKLRLAQTPPSKRETWMHEYCRGVWERWVAAEIEAGTIDQIDGYQWLAWPEGVPKPDNIKVA